MDAPLVLVSMADGHLRQALATALRAEDLQVIATPRARDAIEDVAFHRPTIVVADVALDDGQGWAVVTAAREHGKIATVVIDRENDPAARRAAYVAGADEVATVPFDAADLAARVRALAARLQPEQRPGPVYRFRDLLMDVAAHDVVVGGRSVKLTAQQFAILRALLEAGGATLDRGQLIARTEALDGEAPSDRAMDLHISRLRRRLGDDPRSRRYIEAVYRVGYRLARDEQPTASRFGAQALAALDALPDATLVVDRRLLIRYANRAAGQFFSAAASSLVGRRCADLLMCRSCAGAVLDGPRCLGLMTLAGLGPLRDAPAVVRGPDGAVDVLLTYGRVDDAKHDELLTITIRPNPSPQVPEAFPLTDTTRT